MPGVFGIVDGGPAADVVGYLADAARALSHRPWYTCESWAADAAPVGIGRSAIGLLNRERQPLRNPA
ncbi:MAG: hypothetical protein AB7U83_13835, partial [Vicinamibacterales bacterium]